MIHVRIWHEDEDGHIKLATQRSIHDEGGRLLFRETVRRAESVFERGLFGDNSFKF